MRLFPALSSRLLAAAVGVMVTSFVITAAMPVYLPFNQGDKIAGPILLYPFTWLALFLMCLMWRSMGQVWGLLVLLSVSHGAVIYWALTQS